MLLVLADTEMPALTPASATVSVLVALLALALAALAVAAGRRRANPALKWVAAAFGVFALKNVFSAYNVLYHAVPHDAIELILSLFDLVLLALLFVPLVMRRRA